MKKNILFILIFLLSVVIAFGLALQRTENKQIVYVYLLDDDNIWQEIPTDISPKLEEENLKAIMDYLYEGVQNRNLKPVFPVDVEYYSVSVLNKNTVEVNFKKGYTKIRKLQRGICETALVRSFSSISDVEVIFLYEEGIPLPTWQKNPVFGWKQMDAYLNLDESINKRFSSLEKLYFYSEEKGKLVVESKKISRYSYESKAKVMFDALKNGTETEGLQSLIREKMKVNDIKIRNGVCYVDFSLEFLNAYSDMGVNRRIMLYSIVNTLTELEDVEYVQFLIMGENPENYIETQDMKTLFRKNYVYVE